MEIDKHEFDEMMDSKKESAPGPDGIPYSRYRCAGGLGSQFLFHAFKHVLDGGAIRAQFAAIRTVFIPNFSDVDDNGLIMKSPDALRPLTLCDCDRKIISTTL